MIRDNGINYMESLSSIELNNIFNNKYRGNTPLVLYANGGSWDKLSMRERYNYIHNNYDILANGGTLEDIKRKFAEGGPTISDKEYVAIMEKVAENNNPIWNKYREEEGSRPLTVDEEYLRILNDNSYDYRGYYNKYPKSRVNADTHWPDEFKTVYHPTFSDESIYSGVKSQYNPEGLIGGHWDGDTFIPAPWQTNNDYSSGGSIHIKPENRGKFTALKKRTGHSASWFKAHGTPAQRKMATFALNARKWKHEDGGYLFGDGGENESKYTPLIYIGGTPLETREKYWLEYPRMGEVVDSIAGVYGIDPILIKNNLNHEGFTDNRIKENNDLFEEGEEYDKKGIVNDFLSGKYTNEYNTHGFSEYGFDDGVGAPIINNEIVLPSHITYDIYPEDNEYGKRVQSISGRTPQDNIEITAIMLKHLSDKIKQEYPNLSDYDHNRYVRAFWNKGISNGRKWVQNGAKGYNYENGGHLFDGEEEETLRLNNTSGFYNYDRDKGIIQLPWNTPLRKRMADRREAEIIDLRLNRPTLTDWIKELPASFISDFTASDDYVPELLKTDRMKYIDHLNSKYNLLGEKRIRYSDAPDTQRERGRRPWVKEVGFDKKFDIGGNLLGEGGLEQNELSIGNIGFFNHPLLSLKYYGSPLYDLETPFTVAFTDAIIKDKDDFMWNGKMYSTDIDWNKKFEKDANGNIPFQEFANYMYPAVIKVLKEKGLPLTNAHNIVRQAGLESLYGTNPVSGKGYNLSGIKWNSKTMGNYNHATNSKDNLEYVDFDNLKDYLEFKIDLLNNRYDAINAENDKDFVDRLHLKSSGINKKGFDYSTNYKGYLNMLLNTKSLDKWLKLLYTPIVTKQGNL